MRDLAEMIAEKFLWEIQIGELAVVLLCGLIISMCCFNKISKNPYIYPLPIFHNLRKPLGSSLMPIDSYIPACIIPLFPPVVTVFYTCSPTKIFSSIVQRVMVPVVSFLCFLLTTKYFSIHIDEFSIFPTDNTIVSVQKKRAPIPLIEPVEIFRIYNGIQSLCQGNISERLVKRLDYGVALHAVFSHRSSMKGLLLPAALYHGASCAI